jgi:hypothetical protein
MSQMQSLDLPGMVFDSTGRFAVVFAVFWVE